MKKLLKWFLPSEWQMKMNKERCNPYPIDFKREPKEIFFNKIDKRTHQPELILFSNLKGGKFFIYNNQIWYKLVKTSGMVYECVCLDECFIDFFCSNSKVTPININITILDAV